MNSMHKKLTNLTNFKMFITITCLGFAVSSQVLEMINTLESESTNHLVIHRGKDSKD